MRNSLLVLFVFSILSQGLAQNKGINYALKLGLADSQLATRRSTVLVKGNIGPLQSSQETYGYTFNYAAGDIASITCPLNVIPVLLESKLIHYAELIPARVKTFNDTMIVRNRIKAVKTGSAPLNQAYNGEGILMGIIDTGVDFNHADFKDSLGNTRIKFLWDQKPSSGSTVPSPFGYGIEWTETQINAGQCTQSDVAYYGHGTGVCGIAAGNGLASGHHQGSASKSDMVVVALDFNKSGPTIADAVQYIFDKATQFGKPCVINASLGDYYGSHDGTDLQAQMIDNHLKNIPGRALVSAVGNAGGVAYHVKTETQAGDTAFTWIKNGGTQLEYWFYGDTAQINNLHINVGANRLNFSDLGTIGFKPHTYGLTVIKTDTLKNNGNRIGIIKNASGINSSGVYELYLQINADTTNLYWRIETAGPGKHDAWNFDFVSSPLPSSSLYPKINNYVMPDTVSTMVSGFQCSDEVTTVGSYLNLTQYYDVHDTLRYSGGIAGTFSPFSSIGPTRDGRIKPDICATGNFLFTAMVMSMQSAILSNNPSSLAQDSVHVLGGGTSAASPVVAGLAALYFQRHPTATSADVRQAITSCAYQDSFTGFNLPTNVWGYGKLDGLATMTCGEVVTGGKTLSTQSDIKVYPNPFKDGLRIEFRKSLKGTLVIYSIDGKLIFRDNISGDHYDLNASKLAPDNKGLLIAKVISQNEVSVIKIVKE